MSQIGAAPSAVQCRTRAWISRRRGGDERLERRSPGDRVCKALLEVLILLEDQGLFRGEVGEQRGDGHVGLGGHVEEVAVGDHVFGKGSSTYAEFAVLSAWARMPEGLTFEEAAGYPSVLETALRIIGQVGVRSGQTLLVSGASGGVGSAVLQIARDRGITVIGTAGAANQDYLRSLGALATTYGEGWAERVRQLGHVDAALDLAGSGAIRELVQLTGDLRKVVSIADLGAPELGVQFSGVAGSVPEALTEAASAHLDSHAGHTRGRRVIVV